MRSLLAHDGTKIYLYAILGNLIVQFVGGIVLVFVGVDSPAAGTVNLVFTVLIQVAFAAMTAFVLLRGKRGLGYRIKRPRALTLPLGLLSAAVCIAGFMIPAGAASLLLEKIGFTSPSVDINTPIDMALFVVGAVIAAPVMEEIIFRGALLGGLVKKYGPVPSVILSGLAFSLMHMNPDQTVYQFLLGCACAYLVICSRSVLTSITLHMGSNIIALIIEFCPVPEVPYSSHPAAVAIAGVVLFLAAAAAITTIGLVLAKKERDREGGRLFAFGPETAEEISAAVEPDGQAKDTEVFAEEAASKEEIPADGEVNSAGEKNPEKPENAHMGWKKLFSPFVFATKSRREEDRADEADIAAGRAKGSMLGRRAHLAYYLIGIGICSLMWIMILFTSLSG